MLRGMTDEAPPRSSPARGSTPPAKHARLAREAAALRANLLKRKEQARQRADSSDSGRRSPTSSIDR
jgi:hypothetical protein